MLLKVSENPATKVPKEANSRELDILVVFLNSTSVSFSYKSVGIIYAPLNSSVIGIVDARGNKEVALLSTGAPIYILSEITTYSLSFVECNFYGDSRWGETLLFFKQQTVLISPSKSMRTS